MKRAILCVCLGLCVALGGAAFGVVAQDGDMYAFGFGGGGVAAFWPDLTSVNAFLAENGLPPMSEVVAGGCGSGRGGFIVGPSIGGMGFGVTAESYGSDRSAELAVGGGGIDLGFAVGGDATSVLTFGVVLGGGASVLDLTIPGPQPESANALGIVPEPLTRTVGQAFLMAMPYVSFEAQFLPFLGFDVRIGYLLPLAGFRFGDLLGVAAPSMDLSGPFVSLSLAFGGIVKGSGAPSADTSTTLTGTLELSAPARLEVVNGAGDVVVASVATGELQAGTTLSVQWSATRSGGQREDGGMFVEASTGPDGASLRSEESGEVDYVIRVPPGVDLDLVNGAGAIRVVGHTASAIRASLGVGELRVSDVDAASLELSVGVGEIAMIVSRADEIDAHAGIGRVELALPPSASANISTSAGIGDTSVSGFPAASLRERGFLWTRSTNAVVGAGDADVSLSVGIGEVAVREQLPATKPRLELEE